MFRPRQHRQFFSRISDLPPPSSDKEARARWDSSRYDSSDLFYDDDLHKNHSLAWRLVKRIGKSMRRLFTIGISKS